MTPETRAELRRLAVAARDAQAAFERITSLGEEYNRAGDAAELTLDELHDALTPATILHLLDASEPAAGGEFGARLRSAYGEPWSLAIRSYDHEEVIASGNSVIGGVRGGLRIPHATALRKRIVACVNACAGIADPAYFIATLSAAHARLQAERDKLSADLGEHVRLREKAEHRVEVAKEANALLTAERDAAVAEVGRLREAAAAALVLFIEPGEDTLTRFERIAELYRRDTGRLAPGKDIPMASSDDTPMEERRRLFDEWYNGRIACARAALAGSTS